jgi:DNA-binding FadR family transcriptional regulator
MHRHPGDYASLIKSETAAKRGTDDALEQLEKAFDEAEEYQSSGGGKVCMHDDPLNSFMN